MGTTSSTETFLVALYAFDLSPSLLDGNQMELVKSGSLRLEFKFKAALPEPVHVIAYADGLPAGN